MSEEPSKATLVACGRFNCHRVHGLPKSSSGVECSSASQSADMGCPCLIHVYIVDMFEERTLKVTETLSDELQKQIMHLGDSNWSPKCFQKAASMLNAGISESL